MAAIVFREDQPGILIIANPVDIGWVLAPEALLDFSLQTQNCDLIKGILDIAPITDANFRQLFLQMVEEESIVNVNAVVDRYGNAAQLSSIADRLEEGDWNLLGYNFTINPLGSQNHDLRQLLGADVWIENEGVLPLTDPLWGCMSSPEFIMFGPGARDVLGREKHEFGSVHCVLKGKITLTVIPKGATTTRMNADLRRRLQGTRFPQEILQCQNWLQHANLYYEAEFLRDNYDAKTVELTAGQFVIFQSGVHYQIESNQAGVCVSYSCAPRTWQTAQNFGECEHVTPVLTTDELNKVRENARIIKNHVARTLFLNAHGPTRAVIDITPGIYPQRVSNIHEAWGEIPIAQNVVRGGGVNANRRRGWRGGRGGAAANHRRRRNDGRGNANGVVGDEPILQQAQDEME